MWLFHSLWLSLRLESCLELCLSFLTPLFNLGQPQSFFTTSQRETTPDVSFLLTAALRHGGEGAMSVAGTSVCYECV